MAGGLGARAMDEACTGAAVLGGVIVYDFGLSLLC